MRFLGTGAPGVALDGTGDGSVVMAAPTIAESNFTLTETVQNILVSGTGGGSSTVQDANLIDQASATVETTSKLDISGVSEVEYESLDTGIASVDETGQVRWVAAGTGRILAKSPYLWKYKNVAVSRVGGQTTTAFSSYVSGSLAKLLSDTIDNAIAGKTFNTNAPIFTTMNHGQPLYVRNTANWCYAAGIDLTGLSPWNSHPQAQGGGQQFHGTLLHPRISMHAAHYTNRPKVGDVVRFVDNDNVVYDRTIEAVSTTSDSWNQPRDLCLHLYDSPLPSEINIVQVMPSNWHTYLPHIPNSGTAAGYRVPGMASDQLKYAYVEDLAGLGSANAAWLEPIDTTRHLFHHIGWAAGGDSGSFMGVIAGTQLVLIQLISSMTVQYSDNLTFLDSEMNDLLTGAATTKFDCSGFTAY
jgi:hypothetical protein